MRKLFQEKFPSVEFEFTAKNTPQQNGKAERVAATLWNGTRATLDAAGIHGPLRNELWGEAFMMAVKWWNISVKQNTKKRIGVSVILNGDAKLHSSILSILCIHPHSHSVLNHLFPPSHPWMSPASIPLPFKTQHPF